MADITRSDERSAPGGQPVTVLVNRRTGAGTPDFETGHLTGQAPDGPPT